jgi:hypothetical protein
LPRIVLCLLLFALFCFAIVIVYDPDPVFLSLFTLFLVACWLTLIRRLWTSGGSIPWLQSSAVLLLGPVPWPWRCSCSVPSLASAVLGSSASPWCSFCPRFFGLALVLLLGSSPHRLRLGAPHKTFGLASVLLFGLASVPPLGSSVLHTKPAASVPSSASAVLGSLASLRCSSPAPRLQLGAPHKTFGLALVLLLGSWVFFLGSSVLCTKPAASVLLLGSLIW